MMEDDDPSHLIILASSFFIIFVTMAGTAAIVYITINLIKGA